MSKNLFIKTKSDLLDICIFLLRCNIGLILFVIGAKKTLGLFGGNGIEPVIQGFSKMGISPFLTYVSSYTEMIGGFLLLLGLFTRPVAFVVMVNMLVAVIFRLPGGFFSAAAYPFTFFMISIVVLLAGPMKISIDHFLFTNRKT